MGVGQEKFISLKAFNSIDGMLSSFHLDMSGFGVGIVGLLVSLSILFFRIAFLCLCVDLKP